MKRSDLLVALALLLLGLCPLLTVLPFVACAILPAPHWLPWVLSLGTWVAFIGACWLMPVEQRLSRKDRR
jgi:hypothetical protein